MTPNESTQPVTGGAPRPIARSAAYSDHGMIDELSAHIYYSSRQAKRLPAQEVAPADRRIWLLSLIAVGLAAWMAAPYLKKENPAIASRRAEGKQCVAMAKEQLGKKELTPQVADLAAQLYRKKACVKGGAAK